MYISTKMVLEATPERVYSVLKLLQHKALNQEEIQEMVHGLGGEESEGAKEYREVLSYLSNSQMIKLSSDGTYTVTLEDSWIKTIESFRKYINLFLYQEDKEKYFEFTKWYMRQSIEVLGQTTKEVAQNQSRLIKEKDILIWRIWAKFLGFGYLHSGKFVPNPAVRIKDVLEVSEAIEKQKKIPMKEFVKWLESALPELAGCMEDQKITTFVSLALRTLHDQKILELEYVQDYPDIWHLTESTFHPINKLTHITIGGVEHE